MSILSVNSGKSGLSSSQPALKSALPPRAGGQPGLSGVSLAPTSERAVSISQTSQLGSESAIVSMDTPTAHAHRVGVAAYVAIMTPPTAASMRTEA